MGSKVQYLHAIHMLLRVDKNACAAYQMLTFFTGTISNSVWIGRLVGPKPIQIARNYGDAP